MKYQTTDDQSYTLGMSLTIEALRQRPQDVLRVVLSDKVKDNQFLKELRNLCAQAEVPLYTDEDLIRKLSVKENCFAIGFFRKFHEPLKGHQHILLRDFTNEGNLGTTLRSAVSFNFKDIALIHTSLDPFEPKTVRASMGALFHVNLEVFEDMEDYRRSYPHQTLRTLTYNQGVELSECSFKDHFGIVIPGEWSKEKTDDIHPFYVAQKEGFDLPMPMVAALTLHEAYIRKNHS